MKEKIKEFLLDKSITRERAATCYKRPLERFDNYLNKSLEEITRQDISQFHLHIKNKFKTPTVNYTMQAVKNFLNYYEKPEASKINLTAHCSTPHEEVKKETYFKMLAVLDSGEFWQTEKIVVIRLLWETGMRVSELCNLNISQITQERKTNILTAKGRGRTRIIKWSDETHLLLMKYLGVRLCMNQREPLFISEKRGRVAIRTVERWISQIAKSAGVKAVCHGFRHAKAMNMLRNGANIKQVASALGFSELNPVAVFHYLRQFTKEEEEADLDKFL